MARILVVEDDEHFRRMLHEMLERVGHEVHDAPNGVVALRLDREHPNDLIVIDLVMPEKEGLETILDLRKRRPDVRIIAISGGGRSNPNANLAAAKKLGARWTLTKPFTRNDVLLAIDEVLADAKS